MRVSESAERRPRSFTELLLSGLVGAVPAVMLLASVGKLADWNRFQASLATYVLLPHWIPSICSVSIPAVEAIPIILLIYGYRRISNGLCISLLVLFTAVTVWHWMNNVPPDCACLGLWARYFRINESFRGVLLRNAGLSLTAVLSICVSMRTGTPLSRLAPAISKGVRGRPQRTGGEV